PLMFALTYALIAVDWAKVGAAAAASDGGGDFLKKIEAASPAVDTAIAITIGAVVFSMMMAVVLFPIFQAMVLRWWISGLRLGGLTIHSQLRTGLIYGAYLRFLWY